MKDLVTITFAVFFTLIAFGQEPLSYQDVVEVDSELSKNDLYTNAKLWMAESYNSAQDVIQLDDKENGTIVGKGSMKYDSKYLSGSDRTRGWIRYTIKIQFKDGRYRYEISDFTHEGASANMGLITTEVECPNKIINGSSKKWRNKVWNEVKQVIDANSKMLTASLNNAMTSDPVSGDDW